MTQSKESKIIKAIELTWESLYSHLEYTDKMPAKIIKEFGNKAFHKKAVKQYAEIIKTLADLL